MDGVELNIAELPYPEQFPELEALEDKNIQIIMMSSSVSRQLLRNAIDEIITDDIEKQELKNRFGL